jgi:hypothetical protein
MDVDHARAMAKRTACPKGQLSTMAVDATATDEKK